MFILAYMEQLGILCLKKKEERKKGRKTEKRRGKRERKGERRRSNGRSGTQDHLPNAKRLNMSYKHSRSLCEQCNACFFGGLNFLCLALFRGRIKVSLAPIKLQFMGLVLKHPSSLLKWNNDSSINRVRAGDRSSNLFPWNLNFMENICLNTSI